MLADVRRQVAIANRVLAATGLASGVTAANGHASLRLADARDRFVVKGRGYAMDALSAMRPEDMVVCGLDGNFLEGSPGSTQCFEVMLHACIYRLRPEVDSVVHVHPRFTVLMSTLGVGLRPMCQEGIELVRRPLPMWPHVKTVVTEAEGMEVASLLGAAPAVLLQGHGAATVGDGLEEAVIRMVQLEEQARMNYQALCARGPDYPSLSEAMIAEISDRPPMSELPHFREPFARVKGQPRVAGVWQYYSGLVSADI